MVPEEMQRLKFQSDNTLPEYRTYLAQYVATVGVQCMVSGLVEILRELKLQPNAKTYEILLRLHFGARSCDITAELGRRMSHACLSW